MHIGFQRSGGRGEYEVVGSHSGYTAISLQGWTFYLWWPDGLVRDTDLELEPAESGKPRLRSLRSPQFQIGRMIASMLMLPDPRREYSKTERGLPVIRPKGYVLSRVGFGPDTEFTGMADRVTIHPSFVNLDNLTDSVSIGVEQRWQRIEAVYASIDRLPDAIRARVAFHRDFMASGGAVTTVLVSAVTALIRDLQGATDPWNSSPGADPLPVLEQILGIAPTLGPALPPPDEIGEEEPEVSARSAHQYRLAKMRGASGRSFSTSVRNAYSGRCLFCGGVFGGIPGVRSGVDAAHILAWSKYDLDVVQNGISLCKLHHWAFDAALLMPIYENGKYSLHFTELATDIDQSSLALLGQSDFEIPTQWFPADKAQWPSPRYLDRLYADLAISFTS